MKNFCFLLVCGLLALTFSACKKDVVSSVALPDGYFENEWNKAMQLAQDSNQNMFVVFYKQDCQLCADFKTTLNDPEVQEYMKDRFVRVLMDVEKGQGEALYIAYALTGHPNFIVADPQGNLIAKFEGSMNKEAFLDWINDYQ